MHEERLQLLESNIEALWAPRPVVEDGAVRLAVLIGLGVLLLASPHTGFTACLALGLLALALRTAPARPLLTLAAAGALLALGLNGLTEPGRALVGVGPLRITAEGISQGMDRGLRLVGLVGLGRLAAHWVDAWRLAELVERGWAPGAGGRRLGDVALTVGLALRLLPVLREEAERLRLAMRARPAAGGRGPAFVRELAPFFLPLLAGTLRRAEEVARTLDARAFASGPRSSRLAAADPRPRRLALVATVAVVTGVLVLGRV